MKVVGVRRLAVLAGLLALAAVASARADEGLTIRSGVVPLVDEGRLTACQAPFEVVRSDPEYSGGRRVRIEGLLAVIAPAGSAPGVMLRMNAHGPDAGADDEGAPPAIAAPADGGKAALDERYVRDGAVEEPGFFIFTLGPVTKAVLRGAAGDGRFSLVYALKDGGPMAPLTVDLTVKKRPFGGAGERDPGAPQAFADCLRRLRLGDLAG